MTEYLAEGLKEVKVFVDLALNHVGDNPHDMDKVRNLRTVITGYAPLIFQMTAETTFLERCREVACNIKADPDLPAKLVSKKYFAHDLMKQTQGFQYM